MDCSLKSRIQNLSKVLSLLKACFNLISGSSLSMEIQIMGVKIIENLGFKCFSFHFQILHTKVDIFFILTTSLYYYYCLINQKSNKTC